MRARFFDLLDSGNRVLLTGAGGGFDIVSGVPLYFHLKRSGKAVVLANLSFTDLQATRSEQVCEGTYLVDEHVVEVPYFPEKHLCDWLAVHDERPPLYALSSDLGVRPLRDAYRIIIERHSIDTLVLVDGGTDSLMRGDEPRAGTIVEDACSIVATASLLPDRSYLAAIGFGVEHELNHHACLENMAALTAGGQFLGCHALDVLGADGLEYLAAVDHLNCRMPDDRSIVGNSVAAAIRGDFGEVHTTKRTPEGAPFISPIMGLFWFFRLGGIAERLLFRDAIVDTTTMEEVARAYQRFRILTRPRPAKVIPLR